MAIIKRAVSAREHTEMTWRAWQRMIDVRWGGRTHETDCRFVDHTELHSTTVRHNLRKDNQLQKRLTVQIL